METADNPLLKNLRGRWRSQYSDWPVLAFPSTAVSRHDGISSFSIVIFENVLKLKPQQYSACSISKIFHRKSWDFLQSIRNRLIRWTFKTRAESALVLSRCSAFCQRVSAKAKLCIVISPLKCVITDQVVDLSRLGISAV